MTYRYPRLAVSCLCVACGGGGGGGDPDAGPRADARPCQSAESPALSIAWSEPLGHPSDNHIAFDADGSLLAAVASMGDEPWYCAGLVRFASDGGEIWRHPYDPTPPPAENYAPCPSWWNAIALAPNGAIVTIGDDVTGNPEGATDVVLRKQDGDGDEVWTYYNQNAPDEFEGADRAEDVAVDPDGFIVAVGTVGSRPWVGRFAPNGEPDWLWSGSPGEEPVDVEVAADGTAFVGIATGQEETPYRIARFDPGGTDTTIAELTRHVNPTMTPDGGLVFVLPATDPRLRKIDASGAIVWDQELRVGAVDDACRDVDVSENSQGTAVGPDGSIYLLLPGEIEYFDDSEFPPSSEEVTVLARFSSDGELISKFVHEPSDPRSFAVGPAGEIAMIFGDELQVAAPLEGGS